MTANITQPSKPAPVADGDAHTGPVGFYVTARSGRRWVTLLGPYETHADAEANFDRAARYADDHYSDTLGAEYGTARLQYKPGRTPRPGKLNDIIGLWETADEEPVYTIAVTETIVSYRAEKCPFEGEDEHECTGDCTALGDARVLEPAYTKEITADVTDLEMYDGDPITWAVHYIRSNTSALEPSSSPLGDAVHADEWLSGSYYDPYLSDGRVTETTVRLTGDWTPEQRAQVFAAAIA